MSTGGAECTRRVSGKQVRGKAATRGTEGGKRGKRRGGGKKGKGHACCMTEAIQIYITYDSPTHQTAAPWSAKTTRSKKKKKKMCCFGQTQGAPAAVAGQSQRSQSNDDRCLQSGLLRNVHSALGPSDGKGSPERVVLRWTKEKQGIKEKTKQKKKKSPMLR